MLNYLYATSLPALTIGLGIFFLGTSIAQTIPPAKNPLFNDIRQQSDAIMLTLPKEGVRYRLSVGKSPKRQSEYGETIMLKKGEYLVLTGRHESYLISAKLTPKPGLNVTAIFSAESFGKKTTREDYFLPAR